MNPVTQASLLAHVARWRLTWSRHDLEYRPHLGNPLFVTARHAANRIPDGAVCFSSGMAGNGRCSIFFWALRDRFLKTGHPRGLTWITVGAQGGRGRAPGTIEEIALPGLVKRLMSGHVETKKAMLELADKGLLELHNLPQGQMTYLLEAQARGDLSVTSRVGVGTFLDPRVGTGSIVAGTGRDSLVSVDGNELRYRLPAIDHAFFLASHADTDGNIYMDNATTLTETLESVRAAKARGGKVFVTVADIVPKDPARIYVPSGDVDAIVVNPFSEQTGSVRQRRYWPMFTTHSDVRPVEAVARLKFINRVIGITPHRGPVEDSLARLAARQFTRLSSKGAWVNIGVGLPEEVCRLVFEAGLADDVTFVTETGVVGGIPAPGVFFGAAVCPREMMSSARLFRLSRERLDTTILGVLQADSDGNVNVSKRGVGARNHVGCGGLPDLVDSARNILFVGTWMAHARMEVGGGTMKIVKPGTPKFVDRVDEITFSGKQALAMGKQVWYATNIGLFHLTARGMELAEVMPGVDVRRDVVDACPMRIVLPGSGMVPLVDKSVLTGRGFRLNWP
jgi:propionate CoA-transferase